jgi:hypothetical protein
MINQNIDLDQFFAEARMQEPTSSFEETSTRFLSSLVFASGGVLATKSILQLFTKKWIMMTTLISIATTAAIIGGTLAFGEPEQAQNSNITQFIQEEEDVQASEEGIEDDNALMPVTKDKIQEILEQNGVAEEMIDVEEVMSYIDANGLLLIPEDTTKSDLKEKDESVKIVPYAERFLITENTKKEDLEKIKKSAEDAGIVFDYKAKFKNDKLKELSLNMILNKEGKEGSSKWVQTYNADDFDDETEIIIAWTEDESGKAFNMESGDEEALILDQYLIELDSSLLLLDDKLMDIGNMTFAMDCDSSRFAFAFDCMGDMPSRVLFTPEGDLDFQLDAINASILEINEEGDFEGIDEKVLEAINLKLEALQLELEKLQKQLEERERQREKEERERE